MPYAINPDSQNIELSADQFVIQVSSNGVTGALECVAPTRENVRSGAGENPVLLEAFDQEDSELLGMVSFVDETSGRADSEPTELWFEIADVAAEGGAAVLIDEDGEVTFVPADESDDVAVRGSGSLNFTVPVNFVEAGEAATVRTAGSGIAGKVIFFVGFYAVKRMAAVGVPAFVREVEDAKRYLRVTTGRKMFDDAGGKIVRGGAEPPAVSQIPPSATGEPALLFIHGAFSYVQGIFNYLGNYPGFWETIHGRYGEQIYGFDHHTVSCGVMTNVMQFVDYLAPGKHVFDVVVHSRGGLVARGLRNLAGVDMQALRDLWEEDVARGRYDDDLKRFGERWFEKHQTLPDIEIRRIIFVGTPNQGTQIAKAGNLRPLTEGFFGAAEAMGGVTGHALDLLAPLSQIFLFGFEETLPGLQDLVPGSQLLQTYSDRPQANDAAIRARAEPGSQILGGWSRPLGRLWRKIADLPENDLVVPTEGVNRYSGRRVDDGRLKTYTPHDETVAGQQVWHNTLFEHKDSPQFVLDMLK